MQSPTPKFASDEAALLQKKINDWSQWQWLALMPAWLPGVLNLVNRTPTVPGREGYVLMFRVGMLILGLSAFAFVRFRISRMKKQLAALQTPSAPSLKPPIAPPG